MNPNPKLEPVEYELAKAIEAIRLPFQKAAEEKGLSFDLETAADLPSHVKADQEKIAQVLRDLLSSAIAHTHQGGVRVVVERAGANGDHGRVRVRFRVIDTDVGIPKSPPSIVTGSIAALGGPEPAITKQLVELVGGTLRLESGPGKGRTSAFEVDVEVPESPSRQAPPDSATELEELRPLRILLAEDSRLNLMFISMVLTRAGHEVVSAANGQEAVEAIRQADHDRFDVVLMDVQMPVMDGVEATQLIRTMPGAAARLPIIAMTAFSMEEDAERFRAAGMNGYVPKPIKWRELARVIRELCGEPG